jgi:glutamate carboxypeptidase
MMNRLLQFARDHYTETVALTRAFVECESPSEDRAAVDRMTSLVANAVAGLGTVTCFEGGAFGKHLRCEFALPGSRKDGAILILGHADTVWPVGTLLSMPFRQADGYLRGPGVLDMKSGLAFAIFAARALIALGQPVGRRVFFQVNSDEETGSTSSRPFTEEIARQCAAALVLEFGAGATGKLKTCRKGVAVYHVAVKGREAHAGVDLDRGANAIVELAHQIRKVSSFGGGARGLTVSVGLASGGTVSNVVPSEARMEVDVRVGSPAQAAAIERKFHSLKPVDKRCSLHISGGMRRPPMPSSPGGKALFRTARRLAAEIGLSLEECASGGTSDGNFTAALGIPTLDGLGAVGEGAHAPNEAVLEDRIPDRVALLAGLIASI